MPQQGRLIETPTGMIEILPDGTIRAVGGGQGAPPQLPLTPSPDASRTNLEGIGGQDVVSGILRLLGAGTALAPGYGMTMTGLRTILPALFETGASLSEGKPLGESLEAGAYDAGLGAGGELASRAIPAITTGIALATGGAVGRVPARELARTAGAYQREAQRSVIPPMVGQDVTQSTRIGPLNIPSRTQRQGNILEQAENASTFTGDVNDITIATPDVPTRTPVSRRESVGAFNEETAVEQAIEQAGITRNVWNQLTNQDKVTLINQLRFSTRDLGELQRGTYRQAGPAIEATKRGEPSFLSAQQAQNADELVKQLRELRHGAADVGSPQNPIAKLAGRQPKPGQTGAIKAADSRLADLKTIASTVERMQAPGLLGTGTGAMGGRLFLGNILSRAFGIGDPTTMSLVAGLGLDPKILSELGFLTSKYGVPGAVAATRVTRTQERKPK